MSISKTVCALLILALVAFAQTETGQITGTVTDPTGAIVANAAVTVRNTATGLTRTTTTNQEGLYSVPSLLAGPYTITATAPGFTTISKQATLAVGTRAGVDFALEVGAAETIVQVTDAAAAVNTETQTVQSVITTREVLELPNLTRNPYNFVLTVGNVSDADPSVETNSPGQGAGVAINGMRAASTNVLLDGSSNNDEFSGSTGQSVPLDSVAEFSVITSNFTAEFGRASGGIVNVITKSGTNDLHGTAYEFNRVSRFASNSFESNANGIDKPVFTRNQFGYSVGGPVVKNKLFFFQNTEWIRVRSQANRIVWVPTQQLLSAAPANTREFFNAFGAVREGVVDLGTVSRSELLARNFDPCGTITAGPCAELNPSTPLFRRLAYSYPSAAGGGDPQNSVLLVGRIDYNLSERTQIYGRYGLQKEDFLSGSNADSPFQGFDAGSNTKNQNALLSVVHSFTPTTVSQSKFVFNRLNQQQPLGEKPPGPTLFFFQNARASILGNNVALPGYLPFSPGSAIPFGGPQNFFQLYEDVGWTRGRHQFRFGGSIVHLRDNRTFGAYENAVMYLGPGTNFGQAFDNLLRGQLQGFQAAIDPQGKYPCANPTAPTPECTVSLPVGPPNFSRMNRYNEFAWYVQDNFKLTQGFTLNLGLRWEYFGVQHNADPRLDSNFYYGTGSTIAERIRNGSVMLAPDSPRNGLWKKDFNNFAPRVGFAWDIFGNGRTSLRGGYGIGYERNFGNVTFNVIQNPPNYAVIAIQPSDVGGTIPISTSNAGPLAGNVGGKALPAVSLRHVADDINTAYAHFFSASLEHQLGANMIVAAEYSGSRGENLYSIGNFNRPGAGNVHLGIPCEPGSCSDRLRPTQYTGINTRGDYGFSRYHALNLRYEIRDVSRTGLSLRMNYTWSHAIDNLSTTFSSSYNNFNLGFLDPFNPGLDKGDADFDIRHRFVLAGTWDIPGARNGNAVLRQVLGGWQLSPILTVRTGTPFTIWDSTNAQYEATPRAMFNGSVPRKGGLGPRTSMGANLYNYIDLAQANVDSEWVNPLTGNSEFGPWPSNMSGRNAFRGPGVWNLDLGVYKNLTFTERVRVQLRAEAFNAFNHSNMYVQVADTDIAATGFIPLKRGITSAGTEDRRNLQLGLKVIF